MTSNNCKISKVHPLLCGPEPNHHEDFDVKSVIQTLAKYVENNMTMSEVWSEGLPTGFTCLDKILEGLRKSDLIILAGPSGIGKKYLAIDMISNIAVNNGFPTGVFSCEIPKEQWCFWMLTEDSRIAPKRLHSGTLKDGEYGVLMQSCDRIATAPIFIDDCNKYSISQLQLKTRIMKKGNNVQLIIIDCFQALCEHPERYTTPIDFEAVSRSLKEIAEELEVPVVVLFQTPLKKQEHSEGCSPKISDLDEFPGVVDFADVVMFLHREEVYQPSDPSTYGSAEVIVAKNRDRSTGTVPLRFDKQFRSFQNHPTNASLKANSTK
jgi:replicative DNA helicase